MPDVMVILETRLSVDSGSNIINKLGFSHSIYVSSALLSLCELSEGIWLLWKEEACVIEEVQSSSRTIHVIVSDKKLGHSWIFSVVYAWAQACPIPIRHETWQEFTEIANSISLPWLVMGGFNTIKDPAEKRVSLSQTEAFRTCTDWINVDFMILATH